MGEATFDAKAVQASLIALGYLGVGADDGRWGPGSKRALKRFKRRARTVYRLSAAGKPADCQPGETFKEQADDLVTQLTLDELARWRTRAWKAPLGRFAIKGIGNGKLREDVADAWLALKTTIAGLGGTIDGPYGDTLRALGKATKVGASSFSFHTVGRAIDLRQAFADRPRRYFVAKDFTAGGPSYWRIYCSTDKADGTQGTEYKKGTVEYWDFVDKKAIKIPEGYYLDLTAEIQKTGQFERIPAQSGWENAYNKTEWWHFQWKLDKQDTFQDECELVGISETALRNAGYSDAQMDRKPG